MRHRDHRHHHRPWAEPTGPDGEGTPPPSAAQHTADRHAQAHTLINLADMQHLTGDYPAAATTAKHAHTLYQQLGNRHGQANALQVLGIVHHATGDHATAATTLQQALDLFRGVGNPDGEAETRNHIGQLHLDSNDPTAARQQFTTALTIAQRIDTPTHQARALEGIAHSHLHQNHHDDAIRHLRQALAIYQQINSPHTTRVQAALHREQRWTAAVNGPGNGPALSALQLPERPDELMYKLTACGVQLQRPGCEQVRCQPGRIRPWWCTPWPSWSYGRSSV